MRGFTLLEVIVGMLLLMLLLLGLDALQYHALRKAKEVSYFSIASHQVSQILRISPSARQIYQTEWIRQNHELLPVGDGIIDDQHVAVTWGGQAAAECKQTKVGLPGCVCANISASV